MCTNYLIAPVPRMATEAAGSCGKLPASQILENLCLYLEGRFLIREPLILSWETKLLKKVFAFEARRDWYVCDAAIVSCFDCRFDAGLRGFLEHLGIVSPDHIKIAGGVKCLISPDLETDREFVLKQIRSSMQLHGTRRVLLLAHSDCGGYGRLEAFRGNAEAEARHHQKELAGAAEHLLAAIPGLDVQGYFVDFEGVWDAEIKRLPLASGQ
jgi:hypothetical protein